VRRVKIALDVARDAANAELLKGEEREYACERRDLILSNADPHRSVMN
jgi:hypothetical protein